MNRTRIARGALLPRLAAFGRSWDDSPDDERGTVCRLPRLLNLLDPDVQDRRAFMAAKLGEGRTYAPAWLRLAGLDEHADSLAELRTRQCASVS